MMRTGEVARLVALGYSVLHTVRAITLTLTLALALALTPKP